jgi:hypothetical protein
MCTSTRLSKMYLHGPVLFYTSQDSISARMREVVSMLAPVVHDSWTEEQDRLHHTLFMVHGCTGRRVEFASMDLGFYQYVPVSVGIQVYKCTSACLAGQGLTSTFSLTFRDPRFDVGEGPRPLTFCRCRRESTLIPSGSFAVVDKYVCIVQVQNRVSTCTLSVPRLNKYPSVRSTIRSQHRTFHSPWP